MKFLRCPRHYHTKDSKKAKPFLVPKTRFTLVVKEVQREMNLKYRWSPEALTLFQSVVEDLMVNHCAAAQLCTSFIFAELLCEVVLR